MRAHKDDELMVELIVAQEHGRLGQMLVPAQRPLRGLGCLLLTAQGLHADALRTCQPVSASPRTKWRT